MRPHLIAALVVFSLLAADMAGGGLRAAEDPAGTPRVAKGASHASQTGPPVSEEEARKFAESFEKAILSGDEAAANQLIDWDALIATSIAGIEAPEAAGKSFAETLKSVVTQHNPPLRKIIEIVRGGGTYQLLRVRARNKNRTALFRLVHPGEAGLNYHELTLARRPDGRVCAVDLYVYLSGERLSQTFRREFIKLGAHLQRGFLEKLVGADQEHVRSLPKIQRMIDDSNAGKNQEALNAFRELPLVVQKEKTVLLIRLFTAQAVSEDEYSAAIEDFRKQYPHDACIDLISIDGYALLKRYAEAIACVDRLDKAVGGDPHLNVLRAGAHFKAGDYAAAKADARRMIKEAPEDRAGYFALVSIALEEHKYDETLTALRAVKKKFHPQFHDLTKVPKYDGFVKSPQYKEWLKDQEGEEQDDQ